MAGAETRSHLHYALTQPGSLVVVASPAERQSSLALMAAMVDLPPLAAASC